MRYGWVLLLGLLACDSPLYSDRDPGPDPDPEPDPEPPAALRLVEVARDLTQPVYVTHAGDARIFIVEQPGRIRILENGAVHATTFLDITDRVGDGGERGLLSVAFHPDYASNGFLYVNYTDNEGDTRIERYSASGNAADPSSAKLILRVDQPFANHNGGLIKFGPTGLMFIGMGDGGNGGDPNNHGQNQNTLLGAMLRIDVDHGDPYAIPPGNPYAAGGGAAEIWANGLRNPWRFSIDEPTGTLIIADVGQALWEEIHAEPLATPGLNYGWRIMEGSHCYNAATCDMTGLEMPVHEYSHADGCSITGGYVYRGSAIPGLAGTYFYSDFCSAFLRSFKLANGVATEHRQWDVEDVGNVTSFGVDSAGELYVATPAGRVYRLEAVEETQPAAQVVKTAAATRRD